MSKLFTVGKKSCLPVILLFVMITVICLGGCEKKRYSISIDSGQNLITECPLYASPGDIVTVKTVSVTDGELHMSVNKDASFGEFTREGVYEFVMPDGKAVIDAWVVSDGLTER